jgi:ribosomal protein S18 acetylase RimI-like enzyme
MAAGYRVEAALLGVADFAPLERTAAAVAAAGSTFVGVLAEGHLAAVVEIEEPPSAPVNIAGLVVDPEHFRQGLGSALVRHVLDAHGEHAVTVATGRRNAPALHLYAGLGFGEHRRWTTDDGIPMLTLLRPAMPPGRTAPHPRRTP